MSHRLDPPGKPEITDVTRSSVSLCWTLPFNDGGSKIIGYVVERKIYSTDEWDDYRWLKCNYTTITENYFTVANLGEGETYEYRVIARNAAGVHSLPSETIGPVTCKDEYSELQTWSIFSFGTDLLSADLKKTSAHHYSTSQSGAGQQVGR